jgi:hypothetical protein
MIEQVSRLLSQCSSDSAVLAPTELYNEGWMLRLVLDWFDRNRSVPHELAFLAGARWYSEALLAPAFLPEVRGDKRAESFTHADGVVGHFSIRPGERAEATLLPNARQLLVLEAKLGSSLSAGVKNASNYDQAARNVACMANMLAKKQISPKSLERLGFYVVAPSGQINAGVFGELVTKPSIRTKVAARVAQYGGTRDTWFHEAFEPLLESVDLGVLSWESILERVVASEPKSALQEFYALCLRFNPQRAERAV